MRSIAFAFAILAAPLSSAIAQQATVPAEAKNPDWTDPSGSFSLSYRSLNWDLMSRVRPSSAASDYALQIISADKEYLWCDVQIVSLPLAAGMNQRSISERMRTAPTPYVEGAVVDDPLGGSRVVSSRVLDAGDVSVRRVVLATLDQRRPILRRDMAQFAVIAGGAIKYAEVYCSVGFGSPTARAGEPRAVLESLMIRGESPR